MRNGKYNNEADILTAMNSRHMAAAARVFLCASVMVVMTACTEKSADKESAADPSRNSSPVMASVNGVNITADEVGRTIERTFSQADQLLLNEDVRKKVLDSLVASEALKQHAKDTLSADEIRRIRLLAEDYEEELLVKAYLQQQVVPEPVTNEMVEAYYHQHPERFGGEAKKVFELLRMDHVPSGEQRNRLLEQIEKIRTATDWNKQAKKWKDQYGLYYQAGEAHEGLFEKPLASALSALNKDETSTVIFVNAVPHIVRVTDIKILPPKPLSEVSGQIRKTLAPLQMRKAVKAISEAAVADADVSYKD